MRCRLRDNRVRWRSNRVRRKRCWCWGVAWGEGRRIGRSRCTGWCSGIRWRSAWWRNSGSASFCNRVGFWCGKNAVYIPLFGRFGRHNRCSHQTSFRNRQGSRPHSPSTTAADKSRSPTKTPFLFFSSRPVLSVVSQRSFRGHKSSCGSLGCSGTSSLKVRCGNCLTPLSFFYSLADWRWLCYVLRNPRQAPTRRWGFHLAARGIGKRRVLQGGSVCGDGKRRGTSKWVCS